MTPSSEQRDAIFKTFGRAFFKQDLDLMYEAVTPDFTWTVDDGDQVHVLDSREKIADLRRLEAMLSEVSAKCQGGDVPDCPIIDALQDAE